MASATFACPSGTLDRHANHIVVGFIEDSTQDQPAV